MSVVKILFKKKVKAKVKGSSALLFEKKVRKYIFNWKIKNRPAV